MSLDDVELHLVDSVQAAQRFVRWLLQSERDQLAIDTETTGLNPERDRVRLVQLGDAHTGWAIPWDRWGGVIEEGLSLYQGELVAHNLKFDAAHLRLSCGIKLPPERCHDTLLMAHVLDPTMSVALKNLAARHVDRRAGYLQSELDQALKHGGWTWESVPVDYQPYWSYAALDCVLTQQLREVLEPRLDEGGCRPAYELELAGSWVCSTMERNGIGVDVYHASTRFEQFTKLSDQLSAECKETYGVSPGANADVVRVLQEAGYEFNKETATGAVQLDKEVLEPIAHPLAQLVLRRRRVQKLASTYLRHLTEPRLHPRINPVGTRTGRMSMDTPNLQNLPRKDDANEDAITVRDSFVPAEGNTLVLVDFDQIEMRILAHLSGDEALRAAFHGPVDFFTELSRSIYSEPDFQKGDQRRNLVKNCAYAKIYGAGIAKIAATAGVSEPQIAHVMNEFDRLYPGVRFFQNAVEQKARQRHVVEGVAYVRSPLTGRRHSSGIYEVYKLVNYLIQGMAAELFKQKLVELDAADLGEYLVLPIHDEVILDVPTEDVPVVIERTLAVMNDDRVLAVPITAGASVAERWGQKRDYEGEH